MTTPPKPFTTDGCSGGMSWAWRTFLRRPPPWEGECVTHDRAYWQGGSPDERRESDRILAAAVARRGYPIIAAALYYAIRLGGHPWWPFPWRWGFGWDWPKGYE
ncbi:MAG: hypothetical protein QF578_19175 [Alphaproteobacteria bacterium]|nr:hypothetical protein [Alphaproteobacteria bacterium]MDP6566958.1 hypothetical protein [Alphaproteobacteria bacterium]MDP6813758.1 hypothetical protein [Alphaproteobacteria bacterium]